MKAKIQKIDSYAITDSEIVEFEIPLAEEIKYGSTKSGIETEPMKKNRFLLSIGKYSYLLMEDGRVDLIGGEKCHV